MNTVMRSREHGTLARPMGPSAEADYRLNVALVYQDSATQTWAENVRDLMLARAGAGVVQSTQWTISDLRDPAAFTRGIQALAKADAIVVSVHETDRLPGEFYMWVNLWLQVRSGKPGALVALVGRSGEENSAWIETRRYLHAVASQGGLELFVKECRPEGSSARFNPADLRPSLKAT